VPARGYGALVGSTEATAADRPKVGRPPRISRQMIAEAALELGLEGLTLKAVADHLDVSIAALYHHVSGKDDLMRLAAESSTAKVPRPQDRGQHWAVWLWEWGTYNRAIFLAEPGLLAQYLDDSLAAEAVAANVEAILRRLVEEGFSLLEANAAYELVSATAIGFAVANIRERHMVEGGWTLRTTYREVLARPGADDLPHVRQLLTDVREHGRRPFDEQLTTVIRGIAVGRGARWAPIAKQLAAAASLRC
jgi:AcrR family transcriptional regulator